MHDECDSDDDDEKLDGSIGDQAPAISPRAPNDFGSTAQQSSFAATNAPPSDVETGPVVCDKDDEVD